MIIKSYKVRKKTSKPSWSHWKALAIWTS